ncbi:hypothetical protein AOL_s00091g2 [Orbilia oligospora ATCC 24927]|uniref:Uncharacterized protein n=1 Tax=Arthrobotrys oligospora (strain ATCC 24927 / CBS 115.81 / DSM 1491) TaxID=756982 RepID=G1XHV0_ARTOA|nr:hypothetical protein AOL_s00091g2 [Orbilia oligospora ATCC 24927]EGX47258.1 hypothetical protein AOL_s00091g2 [Orbilia oligospora ATCC 24927]
MESFIEKLPYDILFMFSKLLDISPQAGLIAFPFNRFALARCSRYLYTMLWGPYADGGIEIYLRSQGTLFPSSGGTPEPRWPDGIRGQHARLRHLQNQSQVTLPPSNTEKGHNYFAVDLLDQDSDVIIMHYLTPSRWVLLVQEQTGVCWIAWGTWMIGTNRSEIYEAGDWLHNCKCETRCLVSEPQNGDPWTKWSETFDRTSLMDYQSCGELKL